MRNIISMLLIDYHNRIVNTCAILLIYYHNNIVHTCTSWIPTLSATKGQKMCENDSVD